MSPWWSKHHRASHHCVECDATEHVHRGLCRRCRHRLLAETSGNLPPVEGPNRTHRRDPSLEPPHSRPWVHRGGG
jgi:hypothetical protein